ncbi:hypothetical protein H2203_000335 [Taxawa tesnikishii (nom. ined.)]|nr:hypothetical protein H2203_000335 [Dothideales sp. JES 119]
MNLPASQSNYDAMSWIPTGLPKVVSQKWAAQDISTDPASPNKNRSRDPQGQNQTATEQDDGDIWQEEASRSIEEDQPTQESLQPGDLFLDDLPVKPRRSKLPRTWRRTSGHDFHYSDSPEPEALEIRKLSEPTTAESRIGSEAMTPTTTEDEQRLDCSDDGSEEEIREHPSQTNNRVLSPFSDSGGSATDVDDTGCFWQSNMPSVCGGREESGLCNENLDVKRPSHNAFTVSYLEGGLDSSPLRDTVIESSPVKHNQAIRSPNLPRSSKIRTSPLASSSVRQTEVKSPGEVSDSRVTSDARQLLNGLSARQPASGTVNHSSDRSISEVDTSHESSVASDARQLMNELAEQQRRTVVEILASEEELTSVMTPSEDVWEEETERSYEENLNRNSTVRVAVNFNDSTLDSSLLVPKKAYSPLFGNVPDSRRPPASAPAEPEQSSGIFSRFTSFWSTAAKPASKPAVLLDGISEASTRSSDKSSPLIHGIPDTTLRLRRKYGLLPDVFPFTYRHVRTLHRMMNSSRFHALTCIIPRSGPLPAALAALPGAKKTNSLGQEFTWDEPSLQVVAGFMSLLLPAAERMRLGEAGEWGDEQARAFKGLDSREGTATISCTRIGRIRGRSR